MQRSIPGKTWKQVDKSFKEEGKGDRRSYNRDWKFELEIVFARFLRVEMPTRFAVSVQGYIYIYKELVLASVLDGERFVSVVATRLVINRDGGQYRRNSFFQHLL